MKKARIRNQYGYYDDTNGEYVIIRPNTPTPWMNYLGQGQYGGIISNTAGGYSFDRDPKNRRITRYRYNAVPADQPGRYIYLRDQESKAYWSPTWQPIPARKLTGYVCRHGPGYTRISSSYLGIGCEVLYFVPITTTYEVEAGCELWILRIRNRSRRKRWMRTFSYVEFSNWNADADLYNLDWGQHILHSHVMDGIVRMNTVFRDTTTFLGSSRQPVGFDSEREAFIGEYRDLSYPWVVETGVPLNSQAARGNNIGMLCHDIHLDPGEEKEIIYILGVTEKPATISDIVAWYGNSSNAQRAYSELKSDWQAYLSKLQVHTPDAEMNAMLNVWNQVQCRATLFGLASYLLMKQAWGGAWARVIQRKTPWRRSKTLPSAPGTTFPLYGNCNSKTGTPGTRCSR